MIQADAAERSLKAGDPVAALAHLQERVRAEPADVRLRVFLFQLLCVVGDWDRALQQLSVVSSLDPHALAMAQMYGDAVRCELVRRDVFDGKTSPLILGEPEPWLAWLIESLRLSHDGSRDQAQELRARAFDEAPATSGEIDGRAFEWIADADSRLGPVLEAVINGRYYWVPFSRLASVALEPPEDLRDLVWMPAQMAFENGGEVVALIPTRYAASETVGDGAVAMARKTLWHQAAEDVHHGLGQRILATEAEELPLTVIGSITLNPHG